MKKEEVFGVIAKMEALNPYSPRRSKEEAAAFIGMVAPALESVPADYAHRLLDQAIVAGSPITHISQITGQWHQLKQERLRKAEPELIAPEEIAANPNLWRQWIKCARQAVVSGMNPTRAVELANTRFNVAPAIESAPVPVEESLRRIQALTGRKTSAWEPGARLRTIDEGER